MKKWLFLLLLFRGSKIFAQALYVDPLTSAAMLAHSNVINGQLNNTNNNLSAIERGQLAVSGQLVIVNDMQDKIFRGLSEVAGVINSLGTLKDIAEIGVDIVSDVELAVKTAKADPVLLLFAEQGARDFENRGVRLSADVSSFVLKGGKSNLMDSGERAKLLNHIADELRILRGIAYGMQRAMYWAKMQGIWRTLNPWAQWQNMDVQIANSVLTEAKYLKP